MGVAGVGLAGVGRRRLGLAGVGVARLGVPGLGLAGLGLAAPVVRRPTPVERLVLLVLLVGAATTAAVVVAAGDAAPVLRAPWLHGPWLLPALVLVTCAGELTSVRVRQGDTAEELALYEPAVLLGALLLPLELAVLSAALGLLLASTVRRRAPLKAAFNAGTYATATAGMVGLVVGVAGSPGDLTPRVVLGALLGTLFFSAANLVGLSQVLALVTGVPARDFVREQARLSGSMAVGCAVTGLTTAALALHTPVLLPAAAMPALALTFAYRAAAQEAEERARSTTLLRLSEVLTTAEADLLPEVLALALDAFGADAAAVALVDGRSVARAADGWAPAAADLLAGLPAPGRRAEPCVLAPVALPVRCGSGLLVPVEVDHQVLGALALARRRGRGGLGPRDLALLAPLAGALGAALARGGHLARIREETGKLQAVVEQSTDGILVVDGDGTVQLWSSALAEITGVPAHEAVGRPAGELLRDADDPGSRACVTEQSPTAVRELTLVRPDGERRRLRCAHSAVFSGAALARDVVLVHDLTREHQVQRLKADFIATVSHELRTPLTPIKGYVSLLRTRGDRMTEHKRQECLALVADRTDHLARLVEDLLLASRLGDGSDAPALDVELVPQDLSAVVAQVVADLDDPRCTLVLPAGGAPVPVLCDPGRTVQVLANLVGNALKYAPSPSPVLVALRVEDGRARVAVVDEGPGIPSDHLARVFDKFHRVQDPLTMTTGGSGLGLFIARSLARGMGGDVSVASVLGSGCTFVLELPLRPEPVVPAQARGSEGAGTSSSPLQRQR